MNNEIDLNINAPSALTSERSLTLVKPSYGFIDTSKIIDRFALQGWNLSDAKQARTRRADKQGYQKHLLRFRNDNFKRIEGLNNNNDSIPELIIENSHDGTSSLKIMFGVFRIACLNGIIAGSSLASYRVIHSANAIRNLDLAIDGMTENLPNLVNQVSRFTQIELTNEQQIDIANKAATMRLQHVKNVTDFDINALLKPIRMQDKGNDAYSVFNVIQEKVIRGGIQYKQFNPSTQFDEFKRTRSISSVSQSVKLNRQLWDMLESVAG